MSTSTPSEQNSTYTVTARKWRPTLFGGIVGQEHVTQTLRNAVLSGRIHHAYIFNGPRGVGKTTTARVLAKALNCLHPGPEAEPCNECSSCVDIATGRSIDIIEIDGASNNSVDDVRKLRENAKYPPTSGKYKMYIIDEVHMLSTSAFNALLKTLEEPPRHIIFVFATTEPHRVPATILSRCQRFDFRRMQIDDIVGHLRHIAGHEGITIDEESLTVIAKKGDGSMRDSQSIFDQVVSFCGTNVSYAHVNEALNLIDQEFFFTVSRAIRHHDIPTILELARQVFIRGYDLQECLNGLAEHFRNILTVVATGDVKLIETSRAFHETYTKEAAFFTQADVLQLMNLIITTEQALRFAPQPRLRFEFALIQMARMDSAIDLATLLLELEELKKKIDSGAIVSAPTSEHTVVVPPASPAAQAPSATVQTAPARPTPSSAPVRPTASAPAPAQPAQTPAPQRTQEPAAAYSAAPSSTGQNQPRAEEKSTAPRIIAGAEIERQWEHFVRTSEKLDVAFRRLAKSHMFSVSFGDNQVSFAPAPTAPIVAGTLTEKKLLISEALLDYFKAQIIVHVAGGTEEKLSMFDEPIAAAAPGAAASESGTTTTIAAQPSEQAPYPAPDTASGAAPNAQIEEPPAAELHPLDKAIVEHLNAYEIAIR